jgi:murein DD-endopeptidase MepM/ murein hydrolase activator NlpD
MTRKVVHAAFYLFVPVAILSCSDSTAPDGTVGAAQFPLESWSVLQDLGVWNDSVKGYHLAQDAKADPRDAVYSTADGVVKVVFTDVPGYGAVMLIEHSFDGEYVVSLYGHISTRLGFPGRPGNAVQEGEKSPI